MQYLLVDSHQRFLGMFKSDKRMSLGDRFEHEGTQTYTVVGVNQSRRHSRALDSLTVVKMNPAMAESAAH